jgi:hypothetical protein
MPNTPIAMNGLLDAEYLDFESTHVGDTFQVFVAKPPLEAVDASGFTTQVRICARASPD